MTHTYKWFEFYSAAVLETDWSRLDERIGEAEASIKARLTEFSLNHGGTPEENHAIVDALHRLGVLRTELTSWQESKQN